MSEMKYSGVKWIGEIPQEWSVKRVKYLATENNSLFIDGNWIDSNVITEEGIRYLTTGNVGAGYYKEQGNGYISEETFSKLKCLKVIPGDLMISRLNEPIGRACIVPNTEKMYVVAVDNVILRPNKNYDKKFIMYCMNTTGYAENGKDAARGSTMQRVSRSLLGTFYIPITSLEEQYQIVIFLDNKVEKIDEILKDLNNQIDILNKYKKSLITEIVTKGLDLNEEMKHSGIEWIGKIPEHWKYKPIKYISNVHSSKRIFEEEYVDEGIPFFRTKEIAELANSKEISLELYITRERYAQLKHMHVKKGDILISSIGTIGEVWISDGREFWYKDGNITQIDRKSFLSSEYIKYFIKSNCFMEAVKYYESTTTISALTIEKIKEIKMPLPTFDEQKRIVNYLDKKCAQIDELIADKQKQIEKVEKYKKSLIYEYVTGKKRVKGAEELYG